VAGPGAQAVAVRAGSAVAKSLFLDPIVDNRYRESGTNGKQLMRASARCEAVGLPACRKL